MAYTYQELKSKNVSELREIAMHMDNEAVKGYTQMNKDHLLTAICKALNIDMYQHHIAKTAHKTEIKARIRYLKNKRNEAIEARNHNEINVIRRQIHHLKRVLRKAAI